MPPWRRSKKVAEPQHPALTAFMYVQWALPFAAVAFPFLAAIAAWIELGHWPRPFFDDPKGLNLAVGVFFWLWILSALALLATLPIALILTPIYTFRRWGLFISVLCTVLYIAALLAAYFIGSADPWNLGAWLFD